MQTITKVRNVELTDKRVTLPYTLKPKRIAYSSLESANFMDFISSQHPLINVWLIFSLISIGILSVLLYVI